MVLLIARRWFCTMRPLYDHQVGTGGQSIPMGVTMDTLSFKLLYLGTWTVSENPVYGFNMLATDDRFILRLSLVK